MARHLRFHPKELWTQDDIVPLTFNDTREPWYPLPREDGDNTLNCVLHDFAVPTGLPLTTINLPPQAATCYLINLIDQITWFKTTNIPPPPIHHHMITSDQTPTEASPEMPTKFLGWLIWPPYFFNHTITPPKLDPKPQGHQHRTKQNHNLT